MLLRIKRPGRRGGTEKPGNTAAATSCAATRRTPRRHLAIGVLTLLVMSSAAALPAAAQQLEQIKLAIGYIPNIQFTPLYVGMDKGYYREAGIELKLEYGFGIDIFSLLSVGKIDLGLSDSDQLILAGSKEMGLSAVYQYYQKYPVAIVAKKGVVDTPSQFAGKTIGVPEEFGTSYIGLELFLAHYGLTGKVKIQKIGYTQIPALLSNRIDGAVVFTTNETVKLREMGIAFNEWDIRDFSDMVGSSFITSNKIIAAKGGVLNRFFAATSQAMRFIEANPDASVRIAMKYLSGVDQNQVPFLKASLLATSRLFGSTHGFGYLDPVTYRHSIAKLHELGLIRSVYPASRIIHQLGG